MPQFKKRATYIRWAERFLDQFQMKFNGRAHWTKLKDEFKRTGVFKDPTTLKNVLDQLIEDGIVTKEVEPSRRGPPRVVYSLRPHINAFFPEHRYHQAAQITKADGMKVSEQDIVTMFKLNMYALFCSILNAFRLAIEETAEQSLDVARDRFSLYFRSFVSRGLLDRFDSCYNNQSKVEPVINELREYFIQSTDQLLNDMS